MMASAVTLGTSLSKARFIGLSITPRRCVAGRRLFSDEGPKTSARFEIPQRTLQKVISSSDAVSLVQNGDTVSVSGFVCQGPPEAVLRALGDRYARTGSPNNLTLLFGGGPGDWDSRGLNNLARTKPCTGTEESPPPMLKRTIGSHYGQVPKVAQLAIDELVEAWTLPMGSVSRMIRAQATHSPGHITTVGIGTFVDPAMSGGAANKKALQSPLHKTLVTSLVIDGQDQLMYKALPIHVAIIRGTTADAQGNISIEQESLKCDSMITAAAAKNSGGIVIAQVKRLAANGSIPSRCVAVPAPFVDCVVVVDDEDHDELHPMSFVERHNPVMTGELRAPSEEIDHMDLTLRKVIARRASYELKPNTVVNLGIGLPEGVAAVASEEGMLDFVTLTTEPGSIGGIPCAGHSFGPASNASAVIEMNQMFDFYDGGGLNMCFLGAAQISQNGDVNVSRMSKDRLTGPGGFIDISQSTKNIVFMSTMTAKGLEVSLPGDGTMTIQDEGKVKKFVSTVFEKTFSGDEAVRRGQTVFYVTERAVFRRTSFHDVLELIEIAPGIDLQKDVLDQMHFVPVISPDLKTMDARIFREDKMDLCSEFFGNLEERISYHAPDHILFIELFGININSIKDIKWFTNGLRQLLDPLVKEKGPINMVVNYDGFDLRKGLEDSFRIEVENVEKEYYRSVKRYAGHAFKRAKLARQMQLNEWDPNDLFGAFDTNGNSRVSIEELRDGMINHFRVHLTPSQVEGLAGKDLDHEAFGHVVRNILKMGQS